MAIPLQTTTLDFDTKKLVSIYREFSKKDAPTVDIRPNLSALLQTTLELDTLIRLFFKEMQQLVPATHIRYSNQAAGCTVEIGKSDIHSCNYRLMTSDSLLGNLTFTRARRFKETETAQLESIITTLVYPLKNALRYREALQTALTDPLTGAGNRIALDNAIQQEFRVAARYGQSFSLLMIDIDHFKRINDNYGHCAGDLVLKQVVRAIKKTCRGPDMTFRYGGEEFVVVLGKTDSNGAATIAERIRATIAGLSCIYEQQEIPITVSIGRATHNCRESRETIIKKADAALYQAKQNGRNQVVSATL